MRRFLSLCALGLVLALPARADEPAPKPAPKGVRVDESPLPDPGLPSIQDLGPSVPSQLQVVDFVAGAPAEDAARLRELTVAMHDELRGLSERTQSSLAQLDAKRAEEAPGAAIDIDRNVEQLKRTEMLESLRIQARFAREAGAEGVAVQIDAALARMLEPSIDRESVDRTPRPRVKR